MTTEEAEEIVDACEAFIDLELLGPSKVVLDGDFTAEEVEAVLVLMRANQPGDDRGP